MYLRDLMISVHNSTREQICCCYHHHLGEDWILGVRHLMELYNHGALFRPSVLAVVYFRAI